MLIIVPTRSRPENVAKVVRAWEDTDAFRDADLCFAYDLDDPKVNDYVDIFRVYELTSVRLAEWKPLVPKLNEVAVAASRSGGADRYFAIGFAGDDHLPRTYGWAARYLDELEMMGTGVVSCPDGFRRDKLPTQWAMTADIVRALGRMVPAPVDHLYCDNAVQDLATAADCYAYLDDVLIEHMHPLAGRREPKAAWDDQYRHVNRPEQFRQDSEAYEKWKGWQAGEDVATVRELRSGVTAPYRPEVDGGR